MRPAAIVPALLVALVAATSGAAVEEIPVDAEAGWQAAAAAPVFALPRLPGGAVDAAASWWEHGFVVENLAVRGAVAPLAFATALRLGWDAGGLRVAARVRGVDAGELEVVVADPAEPMDAAQVLVAPDASGGARVRAIDKRIWRIHDPRRQRGLLAAMPPLRVEAAARRVDGGWDAELRLPLDVLGLRAEAGTRAAVQVGVWAPGAGGKRLYAAWFDRGWSGTDPRCAWTVRLAEEASPPERSARSRQAPASDGALPRDPRFHVRRLDDGAVHVYLPAGVARFRALWLTLPGAGFSTPLHDAGWSGHAATLPPHLQRALADQEGIALVGVSHAWISRPDVLAAIADIGRGAGHPGLAELPRIVDGFSAGGKWSYYGWLGDAPERTLAVGAFGFCTAEPLVKDGRSHPFTLPDAALSVPVLVAFGEQDRVGVPDPIAAAAGVAAHRVRGAPWTLLSAPGIGHGYGATHLLALPSWSDLLARRLDAGGALRPLRLADGWLADPVTRTIAPWTEFAGDRASASWLSGAYTAAAWRLLATKARDEITIEDLRLLAELP